MTEPELRWPSGARAGFAERVTSVVDTTAVTRSRVADRPGSRGVPGQRLHATGLLPAPVHRGDALRILLPGRRSPLVTPLYSGDFSPSGMTDDDLAGIDWWNLCWTDLTGAVHWPPWHQVNRRRWPR